ncbi:ABC transporter substrate-binding protein [uncultured Maritalea sp.]|uniref:ABC transporter substrate-binding protein n=1 Tax=uncultured Maritalea sp. TaxID=757249 RepID=UPI0026256CFF|nr:ABC transporter substrate-binding protein [uncultured Maritalea sp.]
MTNLQTKLFAGLLAATVLTVPALAETVLRIDEVAVGELDPAKASDYADSILMFNVYDTLVLPTQGAPGHSPHLAKSWSVDGANYTFELRDDVKFQSGNVMSADDVVFSLRRMQALGAGHSHLFNGVVAEAIDATTVQFKLEKPYAPFVASLVRLPILDKKLVVANLGEGDGEMGDWGQAYLSGHGAGTGAYVVKTHNPQEETVMAKSDNYFLGVSDAAPDEARLRYSLEAATVRALIAKGEHDISSQWLPPEVMGSLAMGGAQLLTESGTGAFYVKMNTTRAPLDDVNCRLALSNAFNYEIALKMVAITDDVSSGAPATGAIPVGMFGSRDQSVVQVRDLDAAREYLAACRYDPAEFNLEITWIAEVPLEERLALLMASNFAEIGIKSTITKVPWALFTEKVAKPENSPNISQIFVNAVTGDPDTLLYGMYHSSLSGTWQSPEHLNDAEVDAALDAGRTASDDAGREAAYSALNDRLMAIAPTIYGFDRQSVFAAGHRVKVPALSDPSKAFGLDGLGFSFRLMEMSE